MHVSVNGVRLFFDVEGGEARPRRPHDAATADPDPAAWRPRFRPLDLPAGLFGAGRCRPDHLSRSSRQWPQRRRPARRLEPGRNGATTSGRSAMPSALSIRSCWAHRSAAWWRCPTPRAIPAHPFETHPDQHRSHRRLLSRTPALELFERFGGAEVAALARRRFLELEGHPDQASLAGVAAAGAAALLPAFPAIPTWRAAPSIARRCCTGLPGPAARAAASTSFPICTASVARH